MAKYILFTLVAVYVQGLSLASDWSYHGDTGPQYWPENFPEYCSHSSQSPINLHPAATTPSGAKRLDMIGYGKNDIPNPSTMEFTNNGHSVQVSLTGDFFISGGPLVATYQAAQFHFHWGSSNKQGSEHWLSGTQYPAEMHIVHWDKDNYQNINEAMLHKNGLAVLGVLLEVGDSNPTFQKLVDVIDEIKYKDDKYPLAQVFAISDLLPEPEDRADYFHYEGSLTTPHCNEVVQWMVYRKPIEVSLQQLAAFRTVFENEYVEGGKDTPMVDNFRPTQPLNGRTVYLAQGSQEKNRKTPKKYRKIKSNGDDD